jgi:hypothetical protein
MCDHENLMDKEAIACAGLQTRDRRERKKERKKETNKQTNKQTNVTKCIPETRAGFWGWQMGRPPQAPRLRPKVVLISLSSYILQ